MKKSIYLLGALASMAGCAALVGCKSGDPNALTIEYVQAGFGQRPYEEIKKAFEAKYPDIKVRLVPNRSMDQTCETRLRQGKASDIMIYNRTFDNVRTWAYQDLIYDCTELFNEDIGDGTTILSRMDDNAKKMSLFAGKYYGVPLYYNIDGFVYDAKLFEANNWKVPTTTKELSELANQIKASGIKEDGKQNTITPFIYAAEDHYLYLADIGWDVAYSGDTNMDKFYEFESAEVYNPTKRTGHTKALEKVKEFFFTSGNSYDKCDTIAYEYAQQKLFKKGAAMMMNGTWFEAEMQDEIEATKGVCNMKMFAMPEISDSNGNVLHAEDYHCAPGKKGVRCADFNENIFIPKACKHLDQAKTFMKWFSTDEACKIWTKYSSAVRPLNLDGENPYTKDIYNDVSDFCKSVIDITNDYQLYYCNSNKPISVAGGATYRPQGYFFKDLRGGKDASWATQSDYGTAKSNWDMWKRKAKETFPDLSL